VSNVSNIFQDTSPFAVPRPSDGRHFFEILERLELGDVNINMSTSKFAVVMMLNVVTAWNACGGAILDLCGPWQCRHEHQCHCCTPAVIIIIILA
jgi:hypothetical protein